MKGPRDLSVADMAQEQRQRDEVMRHTRMAPLFKYMELLLKLEIMPETLSMYKYRMNRVMNEIEKLLGIEDAGEDK